MSKSHFFLSTALILSFIFSSCASKPQHKDKNADDAYLYLEQIETPEALAWVKAQNKKSEVIQKSDRYAQIYQDIHHILLAKDRVPLPGRIANGWVYNFWQDGAHHKGIWRRARAESYAKTKPLWQTLLDVDALAKKENENWVWKGATCLPPENKRCLVRLSRGGKDAVSIREFDLKNTQFVKDGFQLPEAKSNVNWMDSGTLWVGTDFGPGSLTQSGYPRILKIWKRGTALADAKTVFEGSPAAGTTDDMNVEGYTAFSAQPKPVHIITRFLSFFESEEFIYTADTQKLHKIQIPLNADFKGIFQNYALAILRTDWEKAEPKILAGTLIAIPINEIENDSSKLTLETVYAPDLTSTIQEVNWSKDAIFLNILENVNGRLVKARRNKNTWSRQVMNFPDKGSVATLASDPYEKDLYASYESFLIPSSLYHYSGTGLWAKVVKHLPARFKADDFKVEQKQAKSLDGTQIPYFLVHAKNIKLDGKNPTLLYGYGGF